MGCLFHRSPKLANLGNADVCALKNIYIVLLQVFKAFKKILTVVLSFSCCNIHITGFHDHTAKCRM